MIMVVAVSVKRKLAAAAIERLNGDDLFKGWIRSYQTALELSENDSWQNIVSCSDSMLMIETLTENSVRRDWRWNPIVQDCKLARAKLASCKMEKINRVSSSWAHNPGQ